MESAEVLKWQSFRSHSERLRSGPLSEEQYDPSSKR